MTLNEYQTEAHKTAIYPQQYAEQYNLYQLASETGELCRIHSKAIIKRTTLDLNSIAKELGDILWHASEYALLNGFTLQDIAELNLEKLRDRQARNVIAGDGDSR